MIDLHLHLDGSLRPSTVRELLHKENICEFESDEEAKRALCAPEDCRNLNDYLKCFDLPVKALTRPEYCERVVYELAEDLAGQSVSYAEIRFAPLLLANRDMSQAEAVQGAIKGASRAQKEFGIRIRLILCCMRGEFHKENMETVDVASRFLGDYVCALDLAGAEALFPTRLFEEEFSLARKKSIPFTIHAGEADGPESIWCALEFGARRIGHGIRCIEDPALVDYLARNEIALEMCPVSNMQTRVFGNMNFYPAKQLLENGVHLTLNTDNMTVSSTCLKKERELLINRCQFTSRDMELMEQYSFAAAFDIG